MCMQNHLSKRKHVKLEREYTSIILKVLLEC